MELHAHTCLAALVAGEQSHISLQPLSSPLLLKVSGILTYIYLPFPFVCCGREAWKAAAMEVCSVGLKANVCFSQVMRRSVGSGESGIWGDGIGGGLKIKEWETKVVKGVKRRSSSGAAVAVLTSDVNQETMVLHAPMFGYRTADPKSVASIILGGGAGTQLFPLTSTRATPANNRNKNIEHIVILSGDQLYRMDYMDLVQAFYMSSCAGIVHIVSVLITVLLSKSRASDYGLVKIDKTGRIFQFSEKPNGAELDAMFYDPMTPFFTSPRFLPPTKIEKCRVCRHEHPPTHFGVTVIEFFGHLGLKKSSYAQVVDAIISHGCFLRECRVERSIVGVRSRLDFGAELKGIQEADRPCEGFYIRAGITIILKNSTIKDGTVI
ncbi:hypothetical protein GW17_00053698 [Ensete ventricosum]|nr:hypothetical protein GW17_00053698 [Ensete ventricosum]